MPPDDVPSFDIPSARRSQIYARLRTLDSDVAFSQADVVEDIFSASAAAVESYATDIGGVATSLLALDTVMGNVAEGQYSEAVDVLADQADDLKGRLGKVGRRYRGISDALTTYATDLSTAASACHLAVSDANTALTNLETANQTITNWSRNPPSCQADPSLELPVIVYRTGNPVLDWHSPFQSDTQYTTAHDKQCTAMGDLDTASLNLKTAVGVFTAAVDAAVQRLHDLHSDGLDDGFWGDAGAVVSDVGDALSAIGDVVAGMAKWVYDNIENIAAIVAAVALVVSLIPGVGEILGPVLDAVAGILSVLVLAKAVWQCCTGGWSGQNLQNLGWAALGVATFGVGRVAGRGIEIANEASTTTRVATTTGKAGRTWAGTDEMVATGSRGGSVTREVLSTLSPRAVISDIRAVRELPDAITQARAAGGLMKPNFAALAPAGVRNLDAVGNVDTNLQLFRAVDIVNWSADQVRIGHDVKTVVDLVTPGDHK